MTVPNQGADQMIRQEDFVKIETMAGLGMY